MGIGRGRWFAGLATVSLAVLFITSAIDGADANSRFTVDNQSSKSVEILIYDGGDTVCDFEAGHEHLKAGDQDNYGCAGDGDDRCKVLVEDPETHKKYCTSLDHKSCGSARIIRVGNGDTLIITSKPETCTKEKP